jgi:uncharacterized protein (TIGR02246 family)
MQRLAQIIALALLAAGCARSPVPEPFPQAQVDAWIERYAAHDAAGVAALYTPDAQLLPPDQQIVAGRAAIREYVARTNPPGAPIPEIATVETRVFGDYAHRQGSYRLQGAADGAPATGKFIELWKQVDGKWLIHRDIWSADAPPPPLPADADEPA